MSKYSNTKVYWNVLATLDTVEWACTVSLQGFTTKHQTAEEFAISIMRMIEYSQCHVYVCTKLTSTNNLHHVVLEKMSKRITKYP